VVTEDFVCGAAQGWRMRISIFGLGYVGSVSLACLARDGHQLVGVDVDKTKLDLIRSGRSPIVEEGIQELMRDVVASGRVMVTNDARAAVLDTEVSFCCVGTPSSPNGGQNLAALLRCVEEIGAALRHKSEFHVVVVRSTVPPGTVEEQLRTVLEERSGKQSGREFGLSFQPEFLREGSSIRDFDHPPFTIVGSDCERATEVLRSLFAHLPGEFLHTSIRVAEALKLVSNAFHAVKITFANEVGRICKELGVDSQEVMRLVCRDLHLNISSAYLRPGFAFGGSCLPKDLRALTHLARSSNVEVPMLANVLPSNQVHIEHVIDRVLELGRRRVGMLGLSFKTGTDDMRESPLVTLAKRLIGEGCELRIFDPEVQLSRLLGANRNYIEQNIPHIGTLLCEEPDEVLEPSELILVGLLEPALCERLEYLCRPHQHVIDLVGLPNRARLRAGYEGVCW
jgi:GDP-mannose 6-dehydrogenase